MEINPTSSGVQTFLNAQQKITESATKIAQLSTQGISADLTESVVDLKVAEQQATAATKIIEAENNQIGTLLNILV